MELVAFSSGAARGSYLHVSNPTLKSMQGEEMIEISYLSLIGEGFVSSEVSRYEVQRATFGPEGSSFSGPSRPLGRSACC